MTQKGVYPYDYINSLKKMEDTKLPDIEHFYRNLYNSECSEEDYERAQNVWNVFECKTFKYYHNTYLSSDVYLIYGIFLVKSAIKIIN